MGHYYSNFDVSMEQASGELALLKLMDFVMTASLLF